MNKHEWKDNSLCFEYDTNLFFEKYEDDESLRFGIDKLCLDCPVIRQCFAVGVSGKEWGVWGGIYLENGEISKEFNSHKTKDSWASTWQTLTIDT